jgi:hypothetical protein
VRDPLKGWARKDGALAGTFGIQYAPAGGAGLGLEFVQVGQAGVAAQVAGGAAGGLDPHRPAVLEVLLDPRVLAGDIDQDAAVVAAPVAVRKTPRVSRRILRAKMISTLCGRPISRLPATSASKKPRAWRGASKTMVREISTCRIEVSRQ